MDERPAWWETPRRSAGRAVLWVGAGAWAWMAIALTQRGVLTDIGPGVRVMCSPTSASQLPQLGLAAAGVGLTVFSLNVAPERPWRRALAVGAILGLWLVATFAWPGGEYLNCQS